jgi:hypothetical protein
MPDQVTPNDLARELDVPARTIRAWLRENDQRGHLLHARWTLSSQQAAEVRTAFKR